MRMLTPHQQNVVMIIYRRGSPCVSEIAKYSFKDSQTIAATLKGLKSLRVVSCYVSEEDRRFAYYSIHGGLRQFLESTERKSSAVTSKPPRRLKLVKSEKKVEEVGMKVGDVYKSKIQKSEDGKSKVLTIYFLVGRQVQETDFFIGEVRGTMWAFQEDKVEKLDDVNILAIKNNGFNKCNLEDISQEFHKWYEKAFKEIGGIAN